MTPIYRIHPGLGIARLGNSPDAFCISPEQPAALPFECDAQGNPVFSVDGETEETITTFKDAEGRVKRQAARFQVWVYDDESPEGRPLKLGDRVEGGGNAGTLVDIQWRVYLANKKAEWYEFEQLQGEHGYASNHPRRNLAVTGNARKNLIIDPGPRNVDCSGNRRAAIDRDGGDIYATIFPPPLKPESIDKLGDLLTDDAGRLLVLGGHGNSGSYLFDDFGQPRIDTYANNDGWFDDISDGPVMARLVMFSQLVQENRFVDVEYPAWVVVGYPAYVPVILDIVTLDDVVDNMAVTEFAERTDIYGSAGTFDCPQRISPTDTDALVMWRAGRLRWNPEYKPWFYRDVWSILYRPDQYDYLCNVLGQSNYPHNQSTRGTFDPYKLGSPPVVDLRGLAECEAECLEKHHSGELFVETLIPAVMALDKPGEEAVSGAMGVEIRKALTQYAKQIAGARGPRDFQDYLSKWRETSDPAAKEALRDAITAVVDKHAKKLPPDAGVMLRKLTLDHLRKYDSGRLLEECRARCIAANTHDPFREYRTYLFNLLREPGEENEFALTGKPSSRVHNLPLMPLICGDNPITNTLPAKFLRLTDYQYFVLRQWSLGLFYNEKEEGWADPDPWNPYAGWVNDTGRQLDRGVLTNLLGGAFCPGGEVTWIIRNPSIWREPYRIKADPGFYSFAQSPAQANANRGNIPEYDYAAYGGNDLSFDTNFDIGMQPGDLTKYSGIPWQSDFNECSTQMIDVTYEEWNQIYPASGNDTLMAREQRVWETLWWPAHRPMQTSELIGMSGGKPVIKWLDWTPGVPQTKAGDLKMVTEWWRLSFVTRNPNGDFLPTSVPPPNNPPYISVERTKHSTGKKEKKEKKG
jgi:hypothetical protein